MKITIENEDEKTVYEDVKFFALVGEHLKQQGNLHEITRINRSHGEPAIIQGRLFELIKRLDKVE